jgi:hypothetical protein
MKTFIASIALYVLLIAGIIAGGWYGVKEAENLTLFAMWLISFTYVFISFLYPVFPAEKRVYENYGIARRVFTWSLYTTTIILSIAAGWIVTAFVNLISCIVFILVKSIVDNQSNVETP